MDLLLTNKPCSFQNSCVIGMSLSDFHRMTITVTEMAFQKLRLRLECFDNKRYKNDLQKEVYNRDLEFTNNGFSRSVFYVK